MFMHILPCNNCVLLRVEVTTGSCEVEICSV
jgi:hypothetical protein